MFGERYFRSALPALLAVSLVSALRAYQAAGGRTAADLIVNGDFEADADNDGWPDGWPKGDGITVLQEGGNRWIRLARYGNTGQVIPLQPDWWKLRVTCRMRATGVKLGDEGWKDARLAMNFVDESRRHLDPWPDVFHAEGTTGWVSYSAEFRIPSGARFLQIDPSLFGASGTAEFDDVHVIVTRLRSQADDDVPAPSGTRSLWSMSSAWRQSSQTRERICLNDLWRFLPVSEGAGLDVPSSRKGWGWFKVPGVWPRSLAGEAQEMIVSDRVEERLDPARFDQAWYKRDIVAPAEWRGRRVSLDLGMVQTHARVFLDGRPAGDIWFPGGLLDVTDSVKPGARQELAILVTARPLERESQVFMAPDRVISSQASVRLRGITGDVYLSSQPSGATLGDVRVATTTRPKRISLDVALTGLSTGRAYRVSAVVMGRGKPAKRLSAGPFTVADLTDGRLSFGGAWPDAKLWDLDTPGNVYDVSVELRDASGKLLDQSLPERFGFREFRIAGRNFVLNDKPVHLRALFLENMSAGADRCSLEGSRTTLKRMKEYGFNFFITGNYSFQPGAVSYMEGLLRAADETGTLCSFSLPHIRDFRIDPDRPETAAAYGRLAEWLIRRVQNHPAVVLYAMNHNATGYYGDQNPMRIDGIYSPDKPAPNRVRREALLAAEVVQRLDPSRPVYHHQSGNLGAMHTVNMYLNWAPRQERSDWLEHWANEGVKPLFLVEWGLPHISSWSSYRGPEFIWTSPAYQSIWDSEYAAAYIGDSACRMTPTKLQSMAYEEELWSRGRPFYWSDLIRHLSRQQENYLAIQALFAADNWRSHRTWGLSAGLPWDQGGLWMGAPGKRDVARPFAGRSEGLQKPGIVPDALLPGSDYLSALDPAAVAPTVLGRAFLRWNMPLCAYIGGGPTAFTDKAHNFAVGETVRKQLIVLNDTRRDVLCRWTWTLSPGRERGQGRLRVAAGGKGTAPVAVRPAKPGAYTLRAVFDFGGTKQGDALTLHVVAPPTPPKVGTRVALFDPKGMTARMLGALGVRYTRIEAGADLSRFGLLVIGREALGPHSPAPDIRPVRNGLRVLVFEQSYDALVSRLGFRANMHGARTAFVRAHKHPALRGLEPVHLRDWRGSATLVPPHLPIEGVESTDPTWNWLGFANTRVWRCGNRCAVASVLIEKPTRGNWLPIVDCEFDLQYSPLLEYREGRGRVVFCQLDVTGRTEAEPAARMICSNLLSYLAAANPLAAPRRVAYLGDARGSALLDQLAVGHSTGPDAMGGNALLVVGPGGRVNGGVMDAVRSGTNVLCLGLSAADMRRLAPGVSCEQKQAVSEILPPAMAPEFAGISSADVHWRTRPSLAALTDGAGIGTGSLRVIGSGRGRLVLCQSAPWMFDSSAHPYLRATYRRSLFLVARLLANLGAQAASPLLERFRSGAEVFDLPIDRRWRGHADRDDVGERLGWHEAAFDAADWAPIRVPGTFESQIPALANYDGVFWYRLRFNVPRGISHEGLKLDLGAIDDESRVWLNGRFLGEITKATNPDDYWRFPRVYPLQPGMLNEGGVNVLAVRVRDTYQSGGIMGRPRLTAQGPWLRSYYVQEPVSGDDPYRYYRW